MSLMDMLPYVFLASIAFFIIYKLYLNKENPTVVKKKDDVETIECGILKGNLVKCTNVGSVCDNCRCSDDPSQKLDCVECQVIEDSSPYKSIDLDIEQSKCDGDSLEYINGKCKIKNGSYCLPKNVYDIDCNNPFIERKLLTKDESGYRWKCVCKNSNFFSNDNTEGECSDIKVCDLSGQQNGSKGGRSLVNKITGELWNTKSSWDPNPGSKDAECLCKDGEIADNVHLSCVNNTCGEGTPSTTDKQMCTNCQLGYIDCKGFSTRIDSDFPTQWTGQCTLPSCIPDPCNPGDKNSNNYYHKETNSCFCDKGWQATIDDNNPTFGQTCKQMCENNGPCGDGISTTKRGDCIVYNKPGDGSDIWTIKSDNNKGQLITSKKTGNGMSYNFSTSGGSSIFYFESVSIIDENGKPYQVGVVYPNDKYYIKTSEGKYIDFVNKQILPVPTSNLIITLTQDIIGDDYRIKINNGNTTSSYVFVDSTNNQIIVSSNPIGTEVCTNCIAGYSNNSQNELCDVICLQKGSECINNDECCEGTTCQGGGWSMSYTCT